MRDLHLQTDPKGKWSLDIKVVNGWVEQLPKGVDNRDQREPLMMYFMKGTVPHHRDVGISWGNYETGEVTLVEIDNEIKKAIDSFVSSNGTILHGIPNYTRTEDGKVGLSMYRPEEVTL